ncbi:prepilin-type N-terminal cleavage/methylation domain-containing protein [Methylophilaceae bacterium 11]|nr:prepilin-type N-terminal cleavage/methylation domain-containing protein [Methylophilaceae bacterium 11]
MVQRNFIQRGFTLKHVQCGFTLVELVAVITIVGLLAAVAGPKFIGSATFETRGAQGTLLAALRYAQKTAVAQRRYVYLNLNTTTRTLCLGYTSNCSSAVIDPSTQVAYTKVLPSTVALSTTQAALAFDGLGRPVPNASASYSLQNATDLSEAPRNIVVEAETGYVR